MKFVISSLLVFFFILTVVSASHHRRHKASNAKAEENPVEGEDNDGNEEDGGDIAWPTAVHVKNFEVPDVFKYGGANDDTKAAPKKRHGKQRSHPH